MSIVALILLVFGLAAAVSSEDNFDVRRHLSTVSRFQFLSI